MKIKAKKTTLRKTTTKKTTLKPFALIALTALLVFTTCDNGSDPGNPADITWTAVADGAEGAADSTKITFTFSAAVSGLTADDIRLAPVNVSVTKGELSGSGASWVLGISVSGQGYIQAKIVKNGVSSATQEVQVYKEAVNPVSNGGTSYVNEGNQVVFSASTGGSGTYALNTPKEEYNEDFKQWRPSMDADNKYIWLPKVAGSYTWNESQQTITLTPNTVADNHDDNRVMMNITQAEPYFQDMIDSMIETAIEMEMTYGNAATQEEAETIVLERYNEEEGTNCTTLDELITALAAIRLAKAFEPSSYVHTFSNDSVSLILLEMLPPDIGTDELGGIAYSGTIVISDWLTGAGDPEPDPTQIFMFNAAGKTYIATSSSELGGTVTGSYSYDSDAKRVYLKPWTKDGLTPEQYYDAAPYYDDYNRHPTEADKRTSDTHQSFKVTSYVYDPVNKLIMTNRDGGGIEPL